MISLVVRTFDFYDCSLFEARLKRFYRFLFVEVFTARCHIQRADATVSCLSVRR